MTQPPTACVTLIVIAKEPLPGQAKTRLCPPCTQVQAARLAEAALLDTLAAVAATPAPRHVLVFEGDATHLRPPGFELFPQRGDGLEQRLAAAFEDVGGPALLVGMDTPQITTELLEDGLRALGQGGFDAVLGPAPDGGYWSIGLSTEQPPSAVFEGIQMSLETTCAQQRSRIRELGLRLYEQPSLRDVDRFEDAQAVALGAPASRFAACLQAASAEIRAERGLAA